MSVPAPVPRRLGIDVRPGAIPSLDGLRAVAIVLVVARHGIRPFWDETAETGLSAWRLAVPALNGWMGVDLFFVLSGFLICRHLLARSGPAGAPSVGPYLVGRALRILPAYLVVVAVLALGLVPWFPVASTDVGRSVAVHLLFLQDLLGSDLAVVLWSLGVEEKFYLAAPLMMWAILRLARPRDRILALAALAVVPVALRLGAVVSGHAPDSYDTWFTDLRSPFPLTFDGLAIGAACAVAHHHRDELRWANVQTARLLFRGGALGFGAVLVATPWLDRIDTFDRVGLQSVLGVLAGALVLGAALGGTSSPTLSAPWVVATARLSYTWYLVHILFIPLALGAVASGSVVRDPRALAAFLPLYLGTSLAAALALHLGVERPALAWRDRLLGRRPPRAAPHSTTEAQDGGLRPVGPA